MAMKNKKKKNVLKLLNSTDYYKSIIMHYIITKYVTGEEVNEYIYAMHLYFLYTHTYI